MAVVVHGARDPRRVAAEKRAEVLAAMRERHRGKRVSAMTAAERAELLEALTIAVGLADQDGVVE